MNFTKIASSLVFIALAPFSVASPIVSYTETTESGFHVLDFTIQNTMNPDMNVYLFGVNLPGSDIVAAPGTFVGGGGFNPSVLYGGSNTLYDRYFQDSTIVTLSSGMTLSGFKVRIYDLAIPSSVQWVILGYGYGGYASTYTGLDYFNSSTMPGFEGTAHFAPSTEAGGNNVPDTGSSLAFLLFSVASTFAVSRMRR